MIGCKSDFKSDELTLIRKRQAYEMELKAIYETRDIA
jgi:hypothetical protein